VGGDVLQRTLDGLWNWWWGGQRRVGRHHLVTVGIGDILDGHWHIFGRCPRLASLHHPLFAVKVTLLLHIDRVVQLNSVSKAVNIHLLLGTENIGIFVGEGDGQQAGESNLQGL